VRFINSALKNQCHIVKNTLPQTAFSAILQPYKIFFQQHNNYVER